MSTNKPISRHILHGGTIHYLGARDNKNILLIIGRSNFQKDDGLIRSLVESLGYENYTVLWYEEKNIFTARLLELESKHYLGAEPVRGIKKKIIKALILLKYPHRWEYFLPEALRKSDTIAVRTYRLRQFIQGLGRERSIVILSRSSGGRVASLVEDEPTIKKLICLGYPFKHPDRLPEPGRVQHLEHMKKPFLIIQGTQDEYGGEDVVRRYALSPQVVVSFIDTNHDFKVSKSEWKQIVAQIKSFIGI
jgi:hypothetical protein